MIDSHPRIKNKESTDRKTMSASIDLNDSFSWFRKTGPYAEICSCLRTVWASTLRAIGGKDPFEIDQLLAASVRRWPQGSEKNAMRLLIAGTHAQMSRYGVSTRQRLVDVVHAKATVMPPRQAEVGGKVRVCGTLGSATSGSGGPEKRPDVLGLCSKSRIRVQGGTQRRPCDGSPHHNV